MVHKLVKRLISGALALTLVFSINGFAAVVTDSDGSAFITKAEFDSLKNSFQAQIDSYNQAIDSKIDGAIAAYLAGIQLATVQRFDPYFAVGDLNSLDIYSVEENKHEKSEKYFNNILGNIFHEGGTSTIMSWTPVTAGKEALLWMWSGGAHNEPGAGQAWVLNEHQRDVVDFFYKKAHVNIHFNLINYVTGTGNSYMGQCLWLTPGCLNNLVLGQNYTGTLNFEHNWAMIKNNSVGEAFTSANKVKAAKHDDPATMAAGDSLCGTFYKEPSAMWDYNRRFVIVSDSVTFTKTEQEKDDAIYLYNKCDATVYMYNNADDKITEYTEDNSLSPDYPLVTYQRWGPLGNFPPTIYSAPLTHPEVTYAAYIFFPHVKIKQNHLPTGAPTGGYTNLNQVKNGKLAFSAGGSTIYPKFFEGLPLFTSSADYEKLEFKINLSTTTIGYTGQMKLWVKEGPFINENDYSSWPVAEKNKLIDIEASGTFTKNSDGSISIPQGTLVTITMPATEKAKTFYLRLAEVDKAYGGKITYLNDFSGTIAS